MLPAAATAGEVCLVSTCRVAVVAVVLVLCRAPVGEPPAAASGCFSRRWSLSLDPNHMIMGL